MINVKLCQTLAEKREFVNTCDSQNTTWVVSDLQAKFELQKMIHKKGFRLLEEASAFRANEFWLELGTRLCPEYSIVSTNLMYTFISDIISEGNEERSHSSSGSRQAAKYVEQFLPILLSTELTSLVLDWLMNNESAMIRWGQWFSLAHRVWQKIEEKKVITHSWISGVIVNHPELSNVWSRDLVVDLGPDLSLVEAEILLQLSKTTNVTIICSNPIWVQNYSRTLAGYTNISGAYGAGADTDIPRVDLSQVRELRRYSTMIAEIKGVTAQVRKWLDNGVDPASIAVLAPDIELFWPSLLSYFGEEGICYDKDLLVNLQSYPEVVRWLGRLRLNSGEVTSGDIELGQYSQENELAISYEKFHSAYSIVYDASDINRFKAVEDKIDFSCANTEVYDREQFITWAVDLWAWSATGKMEMAISKIFSECPVDLRLPISLWVSYLEMVCSQVESPEKKGIPGGVRCLNINGSEWISSSHIFVMGLTESKFSGGDQTEVTLSDVIRLQNDLGIHLPYPDSRALEFKLLWKIMQKHEDAIFSFSGTGFDGGVEAPALIWLREVVGRGEDSEYVTMPEETRWDEIQHGELDTIFQNRQIGEISKVAKNVIEQRKDNESEVPLFGNNLKITLSASKLERYAKCPFLFAADHLFHIEDIEDMDMDLDRMTQGRFMHKLFENLLASPIDWDPSDEKLYNSIETVRTELELNLADERFWEPLREKYFKLGRRFLNFEKSWREEFPETKTIGREVFVKGSWSFEKGGLSPVGDSKDLVFRGVIDRLDQDQSGNIVILDYKSTGTAYKNYKGWLDAKSFQLSLYAEAISKGLGPNSLKQGNVVGASIFDAKKMTREKGFGVEGESEKLVPKRRNYTGSKESVDGVNEDILLRVNEIVGEMRRGNFAPQPCIDTKKKYCGTCRWRILCRAPHLS